MDINYDGLKAGKYWFSSEEDYEKAIQIMDSFDFSDVNVSVNDIFELEAAKRIIESSDFEEKIDDTIVSRCRDKSSQVLALLAKWFSALTDDLFLEAIRIISTDYFDDFLQFFDKFKTYKKISGEAFDRYLKMPDTVLYKVLEYPDVVKHFDPVIAEFMRASSQSADILATVFLKNSKEKYYLPKTLLPSEFEKIFLSAIESEDVHPNLLQLIFTAKSRKECPISDRTKLTAKKKYDEFWKDRANETTFYGYGVGVSFEDVDRTQMKVEDGNTYHFTYDIKWLEENLNYPTILNNFIYVFEYFDLFFCPTFVSVSSKISALESVFMVDGKDCFKKGHQFVISDMLTSSQMALYYQFLENKGIELEQVFQWFFEEYLKNEFGADGFSFTPPSKQTTYLEKIRNIASEMDGVLKQYNMFVNDGCIDRELFEMSSEHIVFSAIKSQLKNKYGYLTDVNDRMAIYYLFSDQCTLSYTDKTADKYHTLFKLLRNEDMLLEDFKDYKKRNIDWLIENGYIIVNELGVLTLVIGKVAILKHYYDNDVLCLKYCEKAADYFENLEMSDTLFSKPEQNYLNYMLNKSTYSDGRDLRNKYIHSTYPKDEETQRRDYIDLLKIMILVIVKINEEFCLKDAEKTEE